MADKVMHFEVHGRDGKRLQEFYGSLFGWQIDTGNPTQYGLVCPEQSHISGGITQSPMGPCVTFYVAVADLMAALQRAEGLGGKRLMEPYQVPDGPEIAMFADPEGNAIGLVRG